MKNDKREIILEAAQKLMCQMKGCDISVSLIAKTAGIAKGSVYYYFESKDQILDAVVEKCYKSAVREFFTEFNSEESALSKIKTLFRSAIKSEFSNKEKNLIRSLHLSDDVELHNKMKMIAVRELSPLLTALLQQGNAEGSIQAIYPKESAEMIVAVITFFLDTSLFPSDNEATYNKLRIFAYVLEICLHADSGSFSFLYEDPDGLT